MSFLDTKYKKKSAIITGIIAVLILVLMFNFGLKFFDPPIEYGISVNFGTTDFGSGNIQPKEALKPMDQEAVDEVEENQIQEENIDEQPEEQAEEKLEATSEDVITQNNEEALAIKKQEEARKKAEAEAKERERLEFEKKENERIEKERIEKQKEEAEARKKKEQDAKKKQLDALMGGLNSNGNASGGEGDDDKPGDKGKASGDPNASGYYGVGGSGSGGNYRLGNRRALAKPKPDYECDEEGTVFVSISVDRNGQVISANPGVKGTTNSASCLLQEAKEAALKTKFSPDSKAPSKQVGLIIYNFSLSN